MTDLACVSPGPARHPASVPCTPWPACDGQLAALLKLVPLLLAVLLVRGGACMLLLRLRLLLLLRLLLSSLSCNRLLHLLLLLLLLLLLPRPLT